MKKLFLKIIILSLVLSNLSFNEIRCQSLTDLPVGQQTLVYGAIVCVVVVMVGVYNVRRTNINNAIKNFDKIFAIDKVQTSAIVDEKEFGEKFPVYSAIFKTITNETLTKENFQKYISIIRKDVIAGVRKTLEENIKDLQKSNNEAEFRENAIKFIKNTSDGLKKVIEDKIGSSLPKEFNFDEVLTKAFTKGIYAESLPESSDYSSEILASNTSEQEVDKPGEAILPKTVEEDPEFITLGSEPLKSIGDISSPIIVQASRGTLSTLPKEFVKPAPKIPSAEPLGAEWDEPQMRLGSSISNEPELSKIPDL